MRGGHNNTLVLNNVLSSASGLYSCSVQSMCGSYSAQYNLSVPSKLISHSNRRSLTVQCKLSILIPGYKHLVACNVRGIMFSPPRLHPDQSVLILVVCGVAALVLVLIMALAMKFKLRRDNGKNSVQTVCGGNEDAA